MEPVEETLLTDKQYYKQRAIEFRREFLKYESQEEYAVIFYDFSDVAVEFDASVNGRLLHVGFKGKPYMFSVDKNLQAEVHGKDIEVFFDKGYDEEVLKELKKRIKYIEIYKQRKKGRNDLRY